VGLYVVLVVVRERVLVLERMLARVQMLVVVEWVNEPTPTLSRRRSKLR